MTDTVDPRLQTRATELFGVRFPIVQTGMGWVAGASLVSGTASAGGGGRVGGDEGVEGRVVDARARDALLAGDDSASTWSRVRVKG